MSLGALIRPHVRAAGARDEDILLSEPQVRDPQPTSESREPISAWGIERLALWTDGGVVGPKLRRESFLWCAPMTSRSMITPPSTALIRRSPMLLLRLLLLLLLLRLLLLPLLLLSLPKQHQYSTV